MPDEKLVADSTEETGASLMDSESSLETGKELYGKARRSLNEKELASPVAMRFMVDQIDNLKSDNQTLKSYQERAINAEADLRVMASQAKLTSLSEKVSSALLGAGSAGASLMISFFDNGWPAYLACLLFVLVAAASFLIKVK